MNIILPLFLLLIANLVLYWIFFGKAKFEKKIYDQMVEKQNLETNKLEHLSANNGFNQAEILGSNVGLGEKK